MSCYSCEGYGVECFSGSCSANYCVFEQQRRLSSGLMYYKKTCSALPYVEYPDGKLSQSVNQCEIRLNIRPSSSLHEKLQNDK